MESVFKGALPSTPFVVAYLRVLFCPRARENARCDAGVAQRTPTISTRALRFVFVEGQSKHAMEHGKQVLKAMLANKHLPKAKEMIGGGREAVTASVLPFMKFEAPPVEAQHILCKEVPENPSSAHSNF